MTAGHAWQQALIAVAQTGYGLLSGADSFVVMPVYRTAELSDALYVARLKASAFVARRVKWKILVGLLIAAVLPTGYLGARSRIVAGQQWVTDRGASVVFAGPVDRRSKRRVQALYAASLVATAVICAALLIVLLILGAFPLAWVVLAILGVWAILLFGYAVFISGGTAATRRELRALKAEMPGGWVIQDLASDGSSFGSSFSLAKAAARSLPVGSVLYAVAAEPALAKIYTRWMEPWGDSGLVFYAITKSNDAVASTETHVAAS